MDGRRLSELIVDSYIQDDQRIVDNQARQEFLNQGRPMSSLFASLGGPSAAQLSQQLQDTVTLAAVDLQAVEPLMNAVDDLALALKNENQNDVARARTYAQSFTNIFGSQVPPSYIDLGNFTGHLPAYSALHRCPRLPMTVRSLSARLSSPRNTGRNEPERAEFRSTSQFHHVPLTDQRTASYTAIANRFAGDFVVGRLPGLPFHRA